MHSEGTVFRPLSEQVLRNRVRERREAAGWTLDDLSRESGVARTTIKEVERGHGPTPTVQARLAAALKARVEDLFWWTETAIPSQVPA